MQRRLLRGPSGLLVSDTFSRQDSNTSLGKADTGQSWSPFANSTFSAVMGITSGQAYLVSVTGGSEFGATIPCGLADGTLDVLTDMAAGGQLGLLCRVLDANNYFAIKIRESTDQVIITRNLAGVRTTAATAALTVDPSALYYLRAVLLGSSIKVYVNGAPVIAYTDTNFQTVATHGLYSGNTGTNHVLDNFSFRQ